MPRTLPRAGRVLLRRKIRLETAHPLRQPSSRDRGRYEAGDSVIIQDGSTRGRFLFSLKADSREAVSRGHINTNDIIGKPFGHAVTIPSTGRPCLVENPSLEDYISRTPRRVTPIYSSYAASIVDLLDIHVAPLAHRLEILDAGTGHGALALHLAKAIAAANPLPLGLSVPQPARASAREQQQHHESDSTAEQKIEIDRWMQYKIRRNAVVHTVESIEKNSALAETVVRGFRRGLYWPHVDFYSQDVGEWLATAYSERGEFLSYALLDLPSANLRFTAVAAALRLGGKLSVFVPSVSQIADCQRFIQANDLPLQQLKVVELGDGISTGRDWDLRYEMTRTEQKRRLRESGTDQVDGIRSTPLQYALDHHVLVCRPKVGDRIQGGGFVGIWEKVGGRDLSADMSQLGKMSLDSSQPAETGEGSISAEASGFILDDEDPMTQSDDQTSDSAPTRLHERGD